MTNKRLTVFMTTEEVKEALAEWVTKYQGEKVKEVVLAISKLPALEVSVECEPHDTKVTRKNKKNEVAFLNLDIEPFRCSQASFNLEGTP